MKKMAIIASLMALALAPPGAAQETAKPEFPSPNAIVDQATWEEWVKIAPSDLLVMDLAPDAVGKARRVIIQLMPEPFSQGWIRNIRKLAEANWWDGTSVNRVQDNYVVQWGDASEKKVLPEDLEAVPEGEYVTSTKHIFLNRGRATPHPSYSVFGHGDGYALKSGFSKGWAVGLGSTTDKKDNRSMKDRTRWPQSMWPVHCYGAIGVGRNYSPDTGSGAELYTVIGHAPRHLDRNIAVVGRIVEGIEHLSSLPRGTGALGFYETAEERVPIISIRLGSELPEADQPRFEYLDTEGDTFAKYADARANRRDPFFIKPAGGADICNIPVPVRRVDGE